MTEEETLAMFDTSMKKKKKKKPTANETEVPKAEAPKELEVPKETPFETTENSEDTPLNESDDKQNDDQDDDQVEDSHDSQEEKGKPAAWLGTDRDYTYGELVERIFSKLFENNPELAKSKRKPMKPPQVFREGTKKTVWANFQEICKLMNRQPDHVLSYALAELGTNGSIDGNHRLVIKGRFQPKQLETVMRHYISEYVSCRTCKSPDTSLKKENRLYFLQCHSCGSTRSVAAVKQGFVAQVGKRKKA